MAGATNREEADILDARLDRSGLAVGLFLVMPTDDDGTGGTEVSGGSYGRVTIGATDWDPAVEGNPSYKQGPTSGVIWAFPAPTADWGEVVGVGLWEGSVLRYYGSLITPMTINNGDPAPQYDSAHPLTVQAGDKTDSF